MKTEKKNSLLQNIIFVIVIFAVAAAGMYFGISMRNSSVESQEPDFKTFESLTLTEGSQFPDVNLLDKDAHTVSSLNLLHADKTIILFIDAECPPCHDISLQFQSYINENRYSRDQVVAISFNDYGYLEEFITSNNLTFSVYTDPDFTFMQTYGIDAYPFAMEVDNNGIITKILTDSNKILKL